MHWNTITEDVLNSMRQFGAQNAKTHSNNE